MWANTVPQEEIEIQSMRIAHNYLENRGTEMFNVNKVTEEQKAAAWDKLVALHRANKPVELDAIMHQTVAEWVANQVYVRHVEFNEQERREKKAFRLSFYGAVVVVIAAVVWKFVL